MQSAACTTSLDLSPYVGHACQLALAPWDTGIDWSTPHDESSDDEHMVPPGLPFALVASLPEAYSWVASIPASVQATLTRHEVLYRGRGFLALWWLSRHTHTLGLFNECPLLFAWMITRLHGEMADVDTYLAITAMKRTRILGWLGLDASPAMLKLVNRMDTTTLMDHDQVWLQRLSGIPGWQRINHVARPSIWLVRAVIDNPEVLDTRYFSRMGVGWPWGRYLSLVREIQRLGRYQRLEGTHITQRLNLCRDMAALTRLHDELSPHTDHRGLPVHRSVYAEPPFPGTVDIEPITCTDELVAEGASQCHCVVSYDDAIVAGNCYVYRVLAPERATLRIDRSESGCWQTVELWLAWNCTPSPATHAAVNQWWKRFQAPT